MSSCGILSDNAKLIKNSAIPSKIEEMFNLLGYSQGKISEISKNMKNCYTAFVLQSDNLGQDVTKIYENIDAFVQHVTKGKFDSLDQLNKVDQSQKLRDEIDKDMKAFADIAINNLKSDDLEFLNQSQDMLDTFRTSRAFLLHSASLKKAENWSENKFVKWLVLNPFTKDRGAVFSSSPDILPVYDIKKKLDSEVNSLHDDALSGKEKIHNKLIEAGLNKDDFGKIVKVFTAIGNIEPNKRGDINNLIAGGLESRELPFDEQMIPRVKEIWLMYRHMNYGKNIGEAMFELPEGYHVLDGTYSDGFLPMFVRVNVRKAQLAKAIKSTDNVNSSSTLIKDAMDVAERFNPIQKEDGSFDIEWRWREQYFPHSKEVSDEVVLGNKEFKRSMDEPSALYESLMDKKIDADENSMFDALTENIENIRAKTNSSAQRMFAAYLAGISGYQGTAESARGLIGSNGQKSTYSDWIQSFSNKNIDNHSTIKEYIDRITANADKTIDFDALRQNAWFKKMMQAGVGMMAQGPLALSAPNNLYGAASQMASELGIKDTFTTVGNWIEQHPSGSLEAEVKDLIIDHQLYNAHGVKLAKHSAVVHENNLNGVDTKGFMKLIDMTSDSLIKTGQTIGEQGILSPFAIVGEILKWSLDRSGMSAKIPIAKSLSTGIGDVVETTKGRFWSMSGSEDLILNVESSIKYSMVENGIALRNNALIASGIDPMTTKQAVAFAKEMIEHPLFKSEVMDKWRHIAGDFSNDAKPFWSWLDMQEASTKTEIIAALSKQMYGMFRPVGNMITKSAFRTIQQAASSNNQARGRLGYTAMSILATAYQMCNDDEGLNISGVKALSPVASTVSNATQIMSLVKVISGMPMGENEFKSMMYSYSSAIGGVPFGGTVQRLAEGAIGTSANEARQGITGVKLSRGMTNLLDDLYDSKNMVHAIVETVNFTDDHINKLNSYKKAYSTSGIPMVNAFTSLNKPLKMTIDGLRISSDIIGSKLTDDEKESKLLIRDAQSNIARVFLSIGGLNMYSTFNPVNANSTAKAKRAKLQHKKDYAEKWKGFLND